MQAAALGRSTVGVSSTSVQHSCGEMAVRLHSSEEGSHVYRLPSRTRRIRTKTRDNE